MVASTKTIDQVYRVLIQHLPSVKITAILADLSYVTGNESFLQTVIGLTRRHQTPMVVHPTLQDEMIQGTPPRVLVPVEDLFNHVNDFTIGVRRAVAAREYSKVDAARATFKAWCEKVGLPIDFTEMEG